MKAPIIPILALFHSVASSTSAFRSLSPRHHHGHAPSLANDGPRTTPTPAAPLHRQRAMGRSPPSPPLHSSSSSSSSSSSAAAVVADVESRAASAVETWSIEATPFMEPDEADAVELAFRDRVDVVAFRVVGGRRRSSSPPSDGGGSSSSSSSSSSPSSLPGEGRRSRFVLVHPDLGLDAGTAEIEHSSVIRVTNVDLAASNTFPNALASIGVNLDDVGDVVVSSPSTVHLVVDPSVVKRCLRLLSKELAGAGIDLSLCEQNEFMPDGTMQEMKLSKSLVRQMGRKKHEGGFVRFG